MSETAQLTLADPVVTIGVRHTIAAYTRALDSGRLDELIGLFAPEGRSALPQMEPAVGHTALRALYAPLMADHPQRHVVVDTVVTRRDDGRALATSTLLWVNSRDHAWIIELVGTYEDVLVQTDSEQWVFEERALSFDTP
ncbi:nuclear transport factor 2 family protein [Gordonia insulae]|uniref:SnoaL-like domain-containing protein n=1 Tax=Gordonia insulae TaxID=2420509 RepID=A0A3G8JMU5_9ACTN|nr:nuclear transport factor 2 family protein [Gordonia insulae]AZG45902.1 hypothetical protein D7316_02502 [Gordonia insulae]